ncbi:hypothetical protein GQ55_1G235100 [Panicum hallii var. hallii]|uniref:Uncharacterized protein n=1 Tax=Panicum hallii var. hallii TaxID=1504633 RepID=A0A2T7F6T1_9POAL|nr:hypothetical protein GQ55_1G235100 [Panicum hallii var. hallii]PUZ75793.1 hypothetical protein GQ55_1G235100 [Panicum hallii var. hallii]
MLREAAAELTVTGGASIATKIRKRCAVSPSGASPDRQRRTLRLKRGVRLIGHRRGGGTGTGTGASPCASSGRKRRMSESSWNRHGRHGHADVETRSAASARKLVSALWQLNKGDGGALEEEEEEIGWDAAAARRSSDHRRSASLEFSKISRRKSKALKDDGDQRSWHNGHAHGQWFSDVMSNGGTVKVHTCPQGRTPARPGGDRAAQAQDLYNSLTASAELVRVLANVLGPAGALGPTAASLLAALRSELDAARARARRLARQHHGRDEEEHHRLRRQLAEEVRAWKARHREKAAAAARLVASELDGERRSRRRAERVGKKLAEALADAEGSLRAATRELEREKAARARLEKVCDELSRGVGGGGAVAEEEELRREAAEAAREELEREREMLQLADELREERVRMKLAEARIQFEEKNAAVDRLRQELEAFLGTSSKEDHQESPFHDEHRHTVDDHRSLQLVLASEFGVDGIDRVVTDKTGQVENGNDGEADDGSEGSDIELNMDGNSWSYKTTSRATTAKNAASVHGSLSDRGTESGAGAGAGAFDRRSQGTRDALELQEWDDVCSDDGASTKDLDEDAERYEAIKNLREQMLAGHGFVFLSQGDADADRDRHRQGLVPQFEDGGLW